jgi:tetratricopeptide (TPR) repeat protein
MKYRVVLAFSVFVPFAAHAAVETQPAPAQDLKSAVKTCFEGSAADKVPACTTIINSGMLMSDPARSAVVHAFRGKALLDLRKEAPAIEDFDQAISLTPNYPAAFYYRGFAYEGLKQYPRAIQDFDQVIALKPDFPNVFAERGAAHVRNKEYAAAVADLLHAIDLKPDDASPRAYLGDVYGEMGKPDLAIKSFGEAIERDGKWMWPRNDRGEVYLGQGDFAHAAEDFDAAVTLEPASPIGWNNRCRLRAITGKLDAALEDCNTAIKLDPTFVNTMDKDVDVSALQDRALVHLKAGRFGDAIHDYDAAEKLVPKSAEVLYGRGLAKHRNGDTAGGDADIAAAKAIDPKIAETYASYGVTP